VDGQVDFKVESAVSKGRMKLGLGIPPPGRCCWPFSFVFFAKKHRRWAR
jgi:hypothetical protein